MNINTKTKRITLANGITIGISHYDMGLRDGRKEFYAHAWKDGRLIAECYSQYINGYYSPYSSVCSSKAEAFSHIKRWVDGLAN